MKKKIISTLLVATLFLAQLSVFAQNEVEKKQESFNVEEDVFIDLNTNRTNVIIETWNRDEVEIEAKVTSEELSEEQLTKIAELWKLDVLGNSNKVSIHSNGTDAGFGTFPEIGNAIGSMTADMIEPLMKNMVGPMLRQMSNNPLPPQFMESLSSLNFDYEAYQDEGEAYFFRNKACVCHIPSKVKNLIFQIQITVPNI